jgi:hypothetical protein
MGRRLNLREARFRGFRLARSGRASRLVTLLKNRKRAQREFAAE